MEVKRAGTTDPNPSRPGPPVSAWKLKQKTRTHQHVNPAGILSACTHTKTHQTWCKTTQPRSCSETSVRMELKVNSQKADGLRVHEHNHIHNHTYTHTEHAHLSLTLQPCVCVFGAVGELRFRAVPGDPDGRLAPHIKLTSIQHARQGSPKTNTGVCRHCRNSASTDWPRVENIKRERLSTVSV